MVMENKTELLLAKLFHRNLMMGLKKNNLNIYEQ